MYLFIYIFIFNLFRWTIFILFYYNNLEHEQVNYKIRKNTILFNSSTLKNIFKTRKLNFIFIIFFFLHIFQYYFFEISK